MIQVLATILGDVTPTEQATKAKISKWGYIKLKIVFTEKETISKTKGNLQNGSIMDIYQPFILGGVNIENVKELKQLNSKNTNNPIKMGKQLE